MHYSSVGKNSSCDGIGWFTLVNSNILEGKILDVTLEFVSRKWRWLRDCQTHLTTQQHLILSK